MMIGKENNSDMIEQQLEEFLRPRSPENKFIDDLKSRLFFEPEISVEYPNYLYLILFICLSLLSGVLIYWGLNGFLQFFKKKDPDS